MTNSLVGGMLTVAINTGLAEGAAIPANTTTGLAISYRRGDGNDVSLRVVDLPTGKVIFVPLAVVSSEQGW